MKKLILFIGIVLLSIQSFGQDKDIPFNKDTFKDDMPGFNKATKEIKLGDIHFYRGTEGDLSNALSHYIKADSFNHYSSDLNYKMGICFLHSTQKYKALEYLEFADKTKRDDQFEDIDFHIAHAYQLDGNWDEAISRYLKFKGNIKDKDKSQRFFINKKVAECRVGKKLSEDPIRVWIDNLGPKINSKYPDFGPVISADNRVLFFTSRRPDGIGDKVDDRGYYFEDIYYSEREYQGEWEEAKNIGESVNTESHDATIGLAPDGKSLLTYHGISRKDGNVLITKQNPDGSWVKTKNIGDAINTKYHESAATLSFDEKTLFYVSNKPGGEGKHDIYKSIWDDEKNEWGEGVNIGKTINTEYDEKGVFFHSDNKTMYFSSEGHNTMGGLDIFKTEYNSETDEWTKPVNIGYPINTPDDDVYFVVTGNDRYAYYSSVKANGYGEKDIYRITFLGDKKEPLLALSSINNKDILANIEITDIFEPNPVTVIRGFVIDGQTNQPLIADISIIDTKTNKKYGNAITNTDGSFTAVVPTGHSYAITSTAKGYTIASETMQIKKTDVGKELNTTMKLYPPAKGDEFVLRNIYFAFDKFDLRHKSVEELDKLVKIMNENPNLKIELGGHTDRRGPSSYNLVLSRKRANIAKEYLVKHNIKADRIQTKGYGETKPEISGATINAIKSFRGKEDAHAKNRRTIVTITSN